MRILLYLFAVFVSSGTAVAQTQPVTAPIVPIVVERPVYRSQTVQELHLPYIPETMLEPIVEVLEQGLCVEWVYEALAAGWDVGELPRLFRIMHRESRCLPDACSESDSGRVCRDWGLMQINDHSWKRTILSQGLQMSDMWNPNHNLRFARWLYEYSVDRNGDGWQPWKIPDKQS